MKTPITMSAKKALLKLGDGKMAAVQKIKAVKSIEQRMREADLHFEFAIEMIRPRNSGQYFKM
jgi:hypothetical protein